MTTVKCGLIQLANPINDESKPVAEIVEAMFQKHLPWIDKAGEQGVQILCLQEIFNGPYFCPSQDARWYEAAEEVPFRQHSATSFSYSSHPGNALLAAWITATPTPPRTEG